VLGVILGLAGLLRGTALLLVPVAMGSVGAGDALGKRLASWGWMLAGVLLILAPPVVHNSRIAGRLVGPTLNAGVNLYIGQGPAANGFYVAAVPGDWRRDPAGRAFLAERLDRAEISLSEADRQWAAAAWRHMRTDPLRALGLTARKIWLQIQGWEIDQLTPLSGWTQTVGLLRVMVVPYALLVILGIVGLVGLRGQRVAQILAAALLVLIVGQSLFFVVSRYRLVLVPLWAALAGVGAVRLSRRGKASWSVAVLAAILTVPWGLNQVRESWAALAQANAGLRWAHVGAAEGSAAALQRAEDLYRDSLTQQDDRPASWLGLAAVLAAQNRPDVQAEVLREGLERVTGPVELQKVLLALELERGRPDEALPLARAILENHPRDADTLHNIAILLARADQPEQALAAAQDLRRAHPSDPRGHVDVGVLLARSGRHEEARAAFENGLRFCPDHPDLLQNLSLLRD
jgi:tetratricopeptide (TPR) repeat protein